MTLLFVVAPLVVLFLAFWRVQPGYLYCGNMFFLAVLGGVNLFEVALCGGVKMDAIPGRLNQVSLFFNRPGTFHGQCSELCGVNHGFMPITVKALSVERFRAWVDRFVQ